MFKTSEPHSSRIREKRGSLGIPASSRTHNFTQQSTLYSMNNSAESPSDINNMRTPLTQNQRSFGIDSSLQEHGVRLTKTPQGQPQSPGPKFKKMRKPAYMKETVLIYADLGAKQIR
mmetsp:Transcript_24294/g.28507  ORF Transcript_24294/g.28507 Transcript_24294/m.28507 type:complete len:117 (-) Transcript_24294:298-648(-)